METDRPAPTDGMPALLWRKVAAGVAVLGCMALTQSCRQETISKVDDETIARVDAVEIRTGDVEKEVQARIERSAPLPELPALVDDMVERRILVGKAIAEGIDRDPDLLRTWENLLIGRYKEKNLRERLRTIEISEQEVAEHYQKDAARYLRPAKARLAILSLPFTSVMSDEEKQAVVARMGEGRARAQTVKESGSGFGGLAVNYSEDQVTRHRGGDTGWLDEGVAYRWPAEIVQAGFALEKSEISPPLSTDDAVYLVRKLDERPGSQIPLAQVAVQIRKELRTAKVRAEEDTFARALRDGVQVEIFPQNFCKIHVPPVMRSPAGDEQPPAGPEGTRLSL